MDETPTMIEARPTIPVEPTSLRIKDSMAIRLSEFFALSGIDPGERAYGLEELQNRRHREHKRAAQALFRALGAEIRQGHTTTDLLKIYPLKEAFGSTRRDVEETLSAWLAGIGWRYQIFGPDEQGRGWIDPDFRQASYHTRTVWIYQPADAIGSFRDYAYTLAWRVTHEIAHALLNNGLTADYGIVGRRLGQLGRTKVYRAVGRPTVATSPLTLPEALRAIEWEHRVFPKQREILETEFGVRITDEDFSKENLINMADATYRILTGHFSSPGDLGVVPLPVDCEDVFERTTGLLWLAARELGLVTLQGSGLGLRHRRVSIPIPVADNKGVRFSRELFEWLEGEFRKLASGFRKHHRVLGGWEDGSRRDEWVVVYEVTIEAQHTRELVVLAEEARSVFHQDAILFEVTGVEKILLGPGEVTP